MFSGTEELVSDFHVRCENVSFVKPLGKTSKLFIFLVRVAISVRKDGQSVKSNLERHFSMLLIDNSFIVFDPSFSYIISVLSAAFQLA